MAQVYDFDRVIGRRGTDSIKFDFAVQMGKPADALPMWVADMDFQSPPGVLEALARRVDHGIFGYTDAMADYDAAVTGWFERRFGWRPDAQWMIRTPGVVNALAMIVRALTAPGDAVLVQPPVYYPFFNVIRKNGRRVVENPLVRRDDGHYEIDFDGFEAAIAENGVKLFILCSPHNPVGRVWTAAELRRMGEICLAHGVYVASDEIHCDFTYPGHPHTPFIAAVPEMAERTVVCTAPSKTFNLAGCRRPTTGRPARTCAPAWRPRSPPPARPGPTAWGWRPARRRTLPARTGWTACWAIWRGTSPSCAISCAASCRCSGSSSPRAPISRGSIFRHWGFRTTRWRT